MDRLPRIFALTACALCGPGLALAQPPANAAAEAPTAVEVSDVEVVDLEEILAENIESRGGLEALRAVASARVTGSMTMGPGMEVPFTMEWKRPDKIRMDFTVQGQTGSQAFDGDVAWMHMPFMGKTEPERMPEEMTKDMRKQADVFEGPLVDWREKGHQVELVGLEDVEGTEAYHLQITLEGGDVIHTYLDADHFLTIRQETQATQGDREIEVATSFGNYREVDGLVLPFSMETRIENGPPDTPPQTITIESYELGAEIDDSRFAFPETEGAAAEGAGAG